MFTSMIHRALVPLVVILVAIAGCVPNTEPTSIVGAVNAGASQSLTITQHPQNTVVHVGQPATFSVTAFDGTPPYTYQWQKNDQDIPGATQNPYTTPAIDTVDNNADFRVIVTDSTNHRAISKKAKLVVSAAVPSLNVNPSSLSFAYAINGATPPSQQITVTISEGTAAWAATTSGGNWLSVSRSGSILTVSVNPTGIAAATYNGTVTVTAPGAQGSPKAIAVTLTVQLGNLSNYYVDKNNAQSNDNGPGSQAQPWRTIQKAMNSATPGSTVNIRAGSYHEKLSLNVSGTPGQYITFQPYGFSGTNGSGDDVFLDYSTFGIISADTDPYFHVSSKSYIRIQGLTFQNFNCVGGMKQLFRIDGNSSYVEVFKNKFLHNKTQVPRDGNALLHFDIWGPATNILVRSNEFGDIESGVSETITVRGASGILIEGNYIHDTKDGIDLWNGASNVTVRGNLLERVGKGFATAIYVDGGANSIIERNTVRDSHWAYMVLSEPDQPAAHDIIIRNNVAYRNTAGGIMVGNWYGSTGRDYNIKVLNNMLFNNGSGFTIMPVGSGVVWKNNILVNNTTQLVNSLGVPWGDIDYNLYFGGSGVGSDVHKVTSDPMFVNASTTFPDLNLQPSSPARNAGDPSFTPGGGELDYLGRTRVVGGRVDMGAFEIQ